MGTVTQHSCTILQKKKVITRCRYHKISRTVTPHVFRIPTIIQFSCSTYVIMSTGLVFLPWLQSKGIHHRTRIVGGFIRIASVLEGYVRAAELCWQFIDTIVTMCSYGNVFIITYRVRIRIGAIIRYTCTCVWKSCISILQAYLCVVCTLHIGVINMSELVPISVLLWILFGDVPGTFYSYIHIFNGPFTSRHYFFIVVVIVGVGHLRFMDTYQRKSNAFYKKVVYFRGYKQVIVVQFIIRVRDFIIISWDIPWFTAYIASTGASSYTTCLAYKKSRKFIHQILLRCKLYGVTALAEGNGYRRNTKVHVLVIPKAQLIPERKRGLLLFTGLWSITAVLYITSYVQIRCVRVTSVILFTCCLDIVRVLGKMLCKKFRVGMAARSLRIIFIGTNTFALVRLVQIMYVAYERATGSLHRYLLANQVLISSHFIPWDAKFAHKRCVIRTIFVYGISIYIESYVFIQSFSGVFAVLYQVSVRILCAGYNGSSKRIYKRVYGALYRCLVVPVISVARKRLQLPMGPHLGRALYRSILPGRMSCTQYMLAHHIMEKVSVLGNTKGMLVSQGGGTRMRAYFIVFKPYWNIWLTMRITMHQMCFFDLSQSGFGVRFPISFVHIFIVTDPAIQQVLGQYILVGLPIVTNTTKSSSCC
ncbi:pB646L [African swine fever virus]|uniref:PB646L n=1 Tax=African swine fever virus TaxID=10497 RepID=A0A8A1UDN6_ASF|nr:pB646L [African swine fever virus]